MTSRLISPGSLPSALRRAGARALASGALQPIDTLQELVADGGATFVVRRVSSLARKDLERVRRATAAQPSNPFLPYEPELFVADVSDSHVALFNKFNVIDDHLLIVTRQFVAQEALLDERDFAALAACMRDAEGLGFYNGGSVAGASQPHKHLQLVPLPLAPGLPAVPLEPLFEAAGAANGVLRAPALPFPHAFARLDPAAFDDPADAAPALLRHYDALLAAIGVQPRPSPAGALQSAAYNLLLTRRWMLAVPRTREHFDAISVNALGFAGSLFVRDEAQLARLKSVGPMRVLRTVATPA